MYSNIMFKILFTLIVLVYFGINFFVVRNVLKILGITNAISLWIITIWFFVSLPLVMWLKSTFIGNTTEFLYDVAMVLFGVVCISFIVFIVFDIVRLITKNPKIWYFFILLAVGLSVLAVYNASNITTKTIKIKSDKIHENVRIAYMSDVHIHSDSKLQFVQKIANLIRPSKSDMIIINWDLIDGKWISSATLKPLDDLNIPIFATLGNHEIYANTKYVDNLLAQTKIQLLIDRKIEMSGLNLYFADEWWNDPKDTSKLEKFLDASVSSGDVNNDNFSILVLNQPMWTELASNMGMDLQLAWHTHKWQIRPFEYVVWLLYKYVYGMHKIWNMDLYVSSWIWTRWPHMRLWTQSELVFIDLSPM